MDAGFDSRPRCVVWLISDSKPGHRTQLEGLVRALARRLNVETHWLDAPSRLASLRDLVLARFPPGDSLPDPHLILGCGHATHLPLLAARRARGGRSVVLMRPSLPLGWFDRCIIPRHDSPPARENTITTRGAINTVRASVHQRPTQGLFLIGGPSKHHDWDDKTLLTQIRQIVKKTPGMRWALTTSRRTPPETLRLLRHLRAVGVEVISFEDTDPGWVADAIAVSGFVWVTEDSVSMVYEALTSGAATGLLWVPRKRMDRVVEGVEQLVADGLATPFLQWQERGDLPRQETPINEADRVASLLVEWLAA